MTITVQAPNGDTVDFPDGTDNDTINAAMQREYGANAQGGPTQAAPPAPPQNTAPPNPQSNANASGQVAPTQAPAVEAPPQASFGLGLYKGITHPFENGALALKAGLTGLVGQDEADKIDLSLNRLMGINMTTEQVYQHQQQQEDPRYNGGYAPGVVGTGVGSVIGTAPVGALTENPFAQGAVMGAGMSDARDPFHLALDTGSGALFGKAGDVGMSMLGNTINPIIRPALQRMMDMGVRLTPGQIAGGVGQKFEDAMTSMPFLGDMIQNARTRGMGDFNTGLVNDILSPLGITVPKDVNPGHEAIAYAQGALDHAYTTTLGGLHISMDGQFGPEVRQVLDQYKGQLDHQGAAAIRDFVNRNVVPVFQAGNGVISGDAMKTIDSQLGSLATRFKGASDAYQQGLGAAYQGLQGAFRNLTARANPEVAPVLNAINDGWANLTRLESAAGRPGVAPGGVVTPNQYKAGVNAQDMTVRNRASAAGNARGQQTAEAAQSVLGNHVPDNGSVRRAIVNGGGLAAGMGGIFGLHMNPLIAAPYIAAMAPYTRMGQGVVQKMMTARPAWAAGIRNVTDMAAPYVSRFMAGIAPRSVPQTITPAQTEQYVDTTAGR